MYASPYKLGFMSQFYIICIKLDIKKNLTTLKNRKGVMKKTLRKIILECFCDTPVFHFISTVKLPK